MYIIVILDSRSQQPTVAERYEWDGEEVAAKVATDDLGCGFRV